MAFIPPVPCPLVPVPVLPPAPPPALWAKAMPPPSTATAATAQIVKALIMDKGSQLSLHGSNTMRALETRIGLSLFQPSAKERRFQAQ